MCYPSNKYSLALDALEDSIVVLVLHVLVEARVAPEGLGAVLALVDSTWESELLKYKIGVNMVGK